MGLGVGPLARLQKPKSNQVPHARSRRIFSAFDAGNDTVFYRVIVATHPHHKPNHTIYTLRAHLVALSPSFRVATQYCAPCVAEELEAVMTAAFAAPKSHASFVPAPFDAMDGRMDG